MSEKRFIHVRRKMSVRERWEYYWHNLKISWFSFWDSLTTRLPTHTYDHKEVFPGTPEWDSAPFGWHSDSDAPRYTFKDGKYEQVK